MSILHTVSTVSVRGGLWAVSTVLPEVNQALMSDLIHCEHTFGAWWVVGCSGTYFTHAQTCDNVRVQSATQRTASVHTQTCDYVGVQSATQRTASVHTSHMPKPVITFVFKVLRKGLLRYIPKPVITLVFKVLRKGLLRYILHTCPNL